MPAGVTKKSLTATLNKIRPALQGDGGDVELVSLKDGQVTLKFIGACDGCAMTSITLYGFIDKAIRAAHPAIKKVELV